MASKNNINEEEWRVSYEHLINRVEELSRRMSTSEIRNTPRPTDQHEYQSDLRTVKETNKKLTDDVDLLKKEVTKLREMNEKVQRGMTSLQQDMALVQSENGSLRRDLDSFQTENAKLRASATTQEKTVDKLHQKMRSLVTENADLRSDVNVVVESVSCSREENDNLRTHVAKMETQLEKSKAFVAFDAELTEDFRARKGDPVICDNVCTNDGDGYDPETGVFTVPVSGLYCFIATTRPSKDDDGRIGRFSIVLDTPDVIMASLLSFGQQMATCHCVRRLGAGQRVWLKAFGRGENWFNPSTTYFTGMLLQREL